MKLNISKGDMYSFVNFTGNAIMGQCEHRCKYCYMDRFNSNREESRLIDKQLQGGMYYEWEYSKNNVTDKFIFIGSGNDMFSKSIPSEDIERVLDYCDGIDNKYLFQTKNPARFLEFIDHPVFKKSILCTTIETNRYDSDIMGNCPTIEERVEAMEEIQKMGYKTMVTIEPIMEFDLEELVSIIKRCNPIQVNIGKNTRREVELPEPTKDIAEKLIRRLQEFTEVELKSNIIKKR